MIMNLLMVSGGFVEGSCISCLIAGSDVMLLFVSFRYISTVKLKNLFNAFVPKLGALKAIQNFLLMML